MDGRLAVSEVFYSLQGEGRRAGEASVFVRLQGCSAKHACAASGVACDTEYESGALMSLEQLDAAMRAAMARATSLPRDVTPSLGDLRLPWVIWTGGEPLDQLTADHVVGLRNLGWHYHALETSGVRALNPDLACRLDWIVVSPKVAEHILARHFGNVWIEDGGPRANVHELRYVRHAGQPAIPEPVLYARYRCLSPHSDGQELNPENVRHCARLCLEHPEWRLSVQQHKSWRVL